MLLTRKNPIAGRQLSQSSFPIEQDRETGHCGYKIGYCPCGEPILIGMGETEMIANKFAHNLQEFKKALKIKIPLKQRLIEWLGDHIPG